MHFDEVTRLGLEVALNEAEVLGMRLASPDPVCELLLHVCAQPEQEPADPDPRRVLRLLEVTRIQVLLREERQDGYGPAVPLADLDAVESFFTTLAGWDGMYGWEYLGRPERTGDWPAEPSLTVTLHPRPAAHTLFWFTDCWTAGAGTRYCIEGTIDFADLAVTSADGTTVPVSRFLADGQRWWDVLYGRTGQPPLAQQRPATAPSWRRPASAGTDTLIT